MLFHPLSWSMQLPNTDLDIKCRSNMRAAIAPLWISKLGLFEEVQNSTARVQNHPRMRNPSFIVERKAGRFRVRQIDAIFAG